MTPTLLLAVFAAAGAAAQPAGDAWDARISGFSGEVYVISADGKSEAPATLGMTLTDGDSVITEPGATADIAFDSAGLVTLGANSHFVVEKTEHRESSFLLAVGSLLAKFEKLGERRLQIRTPLAVAAVRGTEFAVEAEGDSSRIGVFDEGRVEVTGAAGGAVTLTSNQETSLRRGQSPKTPFALRRFSAWRSRLAAHRARLANLRRTWKEHRQDRRERRGFHPLRAEHRRRLLERRLNREPAERATGRERRRLLRRNE